MQGFRLAIEWGHEYNNPPDGKPRVLAEKYIITNGGAPKMPDEFCGLAALGSGYCYTVRHIGEPTQPISQEARASVRQKRLKRRIEKKYPLFADQFIQEEVEKKKDYYNGITDPKIQAGYDEAIQWEQQEFDKLLKLGIRIDKEQEEGKE